VILDLDIHGVPDVDFFTKHTGIAEVSILGFGIDIKIHVMWACRNIPKKFTVLLVRTIHAPDTPIRTIVSVLVQCPICMNFLGFGCEPPVHQVKMMGGFMDQE
jgi:hypothetical protein